MPRKYQETRFEKIHNIAFESEAKGAQMVAEEIAQGIRASISKPYVLGLATGSSPVELPVFSKYAPNEGLSFKNVVTFNLMSTSPLQKDLQSYHHFMHTHLFDHIDILPENIHIPKALLRKKIFVLTAKTTMKKLPPMAV